MKAAQIKSFGHSDVIEVVDADTPTISDDQVLVEVHAASLNPFDTSIREGKTGADITFPATLGGDFAGVVKEVGANVTDLNIGDKVYGGALILGGNSGALAEYAATKDQSVAKAPSNLSFLEAASLPLVGVSALQALSDHMELKAGSKLLIYGASGGIGSAAIQIAKHAGAYVAAAVKSYGVEFAQQLGADEVVDTAKAKLSDSLKDYDYILNLVRDVNWEELFATLKPGSVAVSMTGQPDEAAAAAHQATGFGQMTASNKARLDALRDLIEQGVVTPQIGKVFPLNQARQAFEAREAGGINGKVVIEVKA